MCLTLNLIIKYYYYYANQKAKAREICWIINNFGIASQRLSWLDGSLSAPHTPTWECICQGDKSEELGQSRTSRKKGGKLIGLHTNMEFSYGWAVIGTNQKKINLLTGCTCVLLQEEVKTTQSTECGSLLPMKIGWSVLAYYERKDFVSLP